MAKILIVEDDAFMARVFEKALRFEGYEVELAADGLEGLEKLKVELPDLVLLDLMMPRMNGIEFLETVKANPRTKGIPVVILTNLAGDGDAQLALSKGAVKYIVKSRQDPRESVKMIKEVLLGHTRNDIPS